MRTLTRRVQALEGACEYLTIGELLDSLVGDALPADKSVNPKLIAALAAMEG